MLKIAMWMVFAGAALAQTQELERAVKGCEAAWNRGDLEGWVSYYDDSPETTFIGREVTRGGTGALLERMRTAYPTRESMGKLTFSDIQVRPLAAGFSLVIGRYAHERSAEAGGKTSAIFTSIWKETPAGWKIIHDHMTTQKE